MKLLIIGSSADSHIVLNSPYVSSYHAELLLLDNGDILLEDKGSRNGTFLNENKLQPNKEVNVKRGDKIRFANQMLDWNLVPMLPRIDMKTIKEMRGVGSNFRNRYQLQGDGVSRFHATMKKMSSGKWYIQDHSTNGTTINGAKIPKDQDVRIKKGDKIQCAGVGVPNPCDAEGGKFNWRRFGQIAACVCLLLGISFSLRYIIRSCSNNKGGSGSSITFLWSTYNDTELFDKYKSATVLIFAGYYFKVSAGELNLGLLDLPTEVILNKTAEGLEIVDVSKTKESSVYFGTGFFVSDDGKLITNLHVAKPWLFDDMASKIETRYKNVLQIKANKLASVMPDLPLGAYVSKLKVEGELRFIGLVPNDEDFDDENYLKCKVLSAGDDTNIDVALLRTIKNGLPQGCTYVKEEDIDIAKETLAVGEHIYTMGFPAPATLQDLGTSRISCYGRGGSITRESNEYNFSFDAASYGGASGSPIFNKKGKLVGVLNAGMSGTQGFNFGIKAKYVKELIERNK